MDAISDSQMYLAPQNRTNERDGAKCLLRRDAVQHWLDYFLYFYLPDGYRVGLRDGEVLRIAVR